MGEEKRELRDISYSDSRGKYHISLGTEGTEPAFLIHSPTLPGSWELSVLACWDYGAMVSTHYDREGDPPSKEATIMVRIDNPFNEPRIHKNFPGGIEKLEEYTQEVIKGIHDSYINPKAGKWTYTYHDRLFNYNFSVGLKKENMGHLLDTGINQIIDIITELKRDTTSKAAQATTWNPGADIKMPGDRPCLQNLWARILRDKEGQAFLNLNTDWRSRDLYKAWPMNVYAITNLQKKLAEDLSAELNEEIKVGSYIDKSNSLHIYGAYWKNEKFKNEIEKMRNKPIRNRCWNSDTPIVLELISEAREILERDPFYYQKGDQDKK